MNTRIVLLLTAFVVGSFGDEYEDCKCRPLRYCWLGETNTGRCETQIGDLPGTRCCKAADEKCRCKHFCNSNERRISSCGINENDAYCCRMGI